MVVGIVKGRCLLCNAFMPLVCLVPSAGPPPRPPRSRLCLPSGFGNGGALSVNLQRASAQAEIVSIANCSFTGNVASMGGGLALYNDDSTVR